MLKFNGGKIRDFRKADGRKRINKKTVRQSMTIAHLAHEMGVTYQTVWSWENGKTEPSASQLSKLCEILFIPSPDSFYSGSSKVQRLEKGQKTA